MNDLNIIINRFTDNRLDKKTVGTARNGLGMRTYDVISTNSVPEWVQKALRNELENSGYTVYSSATKNAIASSPPTTKDVVVEGEILNVYCDMYFSYAGQVSLNVQVRKEGKEILNKRYTGKGSAGIVWAATSESYAQSLALALESALRQFISDLNNSVSAE